MTTSKDLFRSPLQASTESRPGQVHKLIQQAPCRASVGEVKSLFSTTGTGNCRNSGNQPTEPEGVSNCQADLPADVAFGQWVQLLEDMEYSPAEVRRRSTLNALRYKSHVIDIVEEE